LIKLLQIKSLQNVFASTVKYSQKRFENNLEQAQKRPKVFGCAQIIYLLNTEQNHLTQLPRELPNRDVGCTKNQSHYNCTLLAQAEFQCVQSFVGFYRCK
jgi:hypothetical protein